MELLYTYVVNAVPLEVRSTVLMLIGSHRNVGHSLPLRYQKFNAGWVFPNSGFLS